MYVRLRHISKSRNEVPCDFTGEVIEKGSEYYFVVFHQTDHWGSVCLHMSKDYCMKLRSLYAIGTINNKNNEPFVSSTGILAHSVVDYLFAYQMGETSRLFFQRPIKNYVQIKRIFRTAIMRYYCSPTMYLYIKHSDNRINVTSHFLRAGSENVSIMWKYCKAS